MEKMEIKKQFHFYISLSLPPLILNFHTLDVHTIFDKES